MDDSKRDVSPEKFIVGGIAEERPFRIRRLGHFGLDLFDIEKGLDFYRRLLGFKISDPMDLYERLPPEKRGAFGPGNAFFMRHGTDHHSFVIFPKRVRDQLRPPRHPDLTSNQITWQVSSLEEVVEGQRWLERIAVGINRSGRDNPGSNWHVYPVDPNGQTNELYYGIEQIGWDGFSKPQGMHRRNYMKPPELPHRSEWAEVDEGFAHGADPGKGYRDPETQREVYNVGGVLLARPFKIVRVGPVRMFVEDIAATLDFYRDILGLKVTEEISWNGHRCIFLRANTEHHSLAIYPKPLRHELGLRPDTTILSFGMQVGSYAQLKQSVSYLKGEGVKFRTLPTELFPGIDYSAFAQDPGGHLIQLYHQMEQIGWDGRPRPAAMRPKVDNANWPETLDANSDTGMGEVYLGPWN